MKLVRAAVVIAGVIFLTVGIWGQSQEGRISGRVTDQSGAVLRKAQVTVENAATGVKRLLETNSAGEYFALDLEPGSYRVSAEYAGFKKSVSTPVLLEVSRDIRVDLQLTPGAVMETMVVTAEGQLADTTNSTLNGVLSNKAISELPVQGRDFQNLLELHPGVQRTPGGGFHSVTSNGNRPDDNNFFIDGADDNDAYYGETVVNDAGISGTPASFLPLDAIQEFNTQESPTADYGVKPGVVMNIGIKSGTNDLHGTAYYFHRNAAFDARNYFDPAPSPLSSLLMHEFGVSLGGPIKKDRWFYFVNYEGIRDKVGNPGLTDSPVTASLASQLGGIANPDGSPNSALYSVPDAIAYYSDPNNVAYCLANTYGTCAVNPLSVQLANLFLPNPGFTLTQSDPAGINFDFNNKNRGENLVAKTDYVLSAHEVLSARFIYANTDQTEEDTVPLRPEWLSTTSPTTQVFGVSLASTFGSAWANDLRFSYNRFNEAIFPVDHNVNPTSYGLNTGVTDPRLFGFPRISPGDQFNYMGGNSSWPLETTPSGTDSFSDTASYTHGKHSIRFGGSFRYGDVDYYRAGYGRGRVDFSDLTDFMDGNVRRWRFLYGDPGRRVSQKSFGFFAQDDFRVRSNVTLNLGVRYDVTDPIKDSRNLLANYDPTSPSGLVQVGQGISSPYPTNYNNLSPRVGIAWDIFGKGKTVFRSGFGIIFEQPSIRTFMFNGGGLNLNPSGVPYVDQNGNLQNPTGTITSFLQESSDGSQINWNSAGPIFPSAAGNQCSVNSQCSLFAVDQHLKTPYVMNWNFNVQQELTRSTLLQIGYVANHGVKLYSITDINQVNPNSPLESDPNNPNFCDFCEEYGRPLVSNCPVTAIGGQGTGGPCFPYFGFVDYLSNRSDSSYNSLQVTLTKRYSHGLYLLAGYTWAHAIDTATSNLAGVPPSSLNYQGERGNGDYDIRHRFTLSVTYDLPSMKSKWQMLEGWQATSIVNLQGGEPYTLGDYSDDLTLTGEYNDRWNMSGPASNIHWSPVNTIPYIDPSQFNTTTDGQGIQHTASGANPAAQLCVNQAFATGGQAAADQLIGNPGFANTYGFTNTSGGCYVSGSTVITPPAPTVQGNMGRNIFRGPTFKNWDFSLSKIWKFKERVKLQFRGEVFNILNHANFDVFSMNTDLSSPSSVGLVIFTPDVAASNPVIGSGGSRHIQLGAKIIW
ncbi:MAG: TonB-dependent receptor [Terriglobales bacterium]